MSARDAHAGCRTRPEGTVGEHAVAQACSLALTAAHCGARHIRHGQATFGLIAGDSGSAKNTPAFHGKEGVQLLLRGGAVANLSGREASWGGRRGAVMLREGLGSWRAGEAGARFLRSSSSGAEILGAGLSRGLSGAGETCERRPGTPYVRVRPGCRSNAWSRSTDRDTRRANANRPDMCLVTRAGPQVAVPAPSMGRRAQRAHSRCLERVVRACGGCSVRPTTLPRRWPS
jgi:hypothetical protein